MIDITEIRRRIAWDVFDYQALRDALPGYSKPRDKIGRLLARGEIVRVKKGLYCFGDVLRRGPIHRGYLANLIYGPSYVSLDYALGHYGLIPERVETVTSVTTRRSRRFSTPFGDFSYRGLSERSYAVGILLEAVGDGKFLIASAEKALADKIWADKRFRPRRPSDYEVYLLEDLRLERNALAALDRSRLSAVARAYGGSPKIEGLVRCWERLQGLRDA